MTFDEWMRAQGLSDASAKSICPVCRALCLNGRKAQV